uniref:Putative secreted protein n=1 Tax=Amblyomma cajennense TaxID=34607 RepID=A0A023FBH4_AMBCJ
MFLYFLALTLIVAALGDNKCQHFYVDDYSDCEDKDVQFGYFYNDQYKTCGRYEYCAGQGAEKIMFESEAKCMQECKVSAPSKPSYIEDK